MNTEIAIEQACYKLAKEYSCLLIKIQAIRGWPDRLLLTSTGRKVFVEFKDPKGGLSPMQTVIFSMLTKMGHPVIIIKSVEDFKSLLQLMQLQRT